MDSALFKVRRQIARVVSEEHTFLISAGNVSQVTESNAGETFHIGRSAGSGCVAAKCMIWHAKGCLVMCEYGRFHVSGKTYLDRGLQGIKQLLAHKVSTEKRFRCLKEDEEMKLSKCGR